MKLAIPYPVRACLRGVLLAVLFALVPSACAEEMVLWWQVGDPLDPGSLSDVSISTFHEGVKTAEEMGVSDARIRVVGTDQYLVMMPVDGETAGDSAMAVPMDWYASVVSPYASAEYSFAVELGNYDYGNGEWTMIATSEAVSYTSLRDAGRITDWDDINPQAPAVWSPTSYTVPEPSGGLLLAVGGALLALRRRRRRAGE